MHPNDKGESSLPGVDPQLERKLARMQPVPDEVFARSLETQLLERLESTQTIAQAPEGDMMSTISMYVVPSRQRWPLTLAAALVAMVLLGALLWMNRPPYAEPLIFAAAANTATPTAFPTFTPTPVGNLLEPGNLRPMVITLTNLLGWTPLTDEVLAEMTVIWIDAAYVPDGTFAEVEPLVGKALLRPVRAWEPILAGNLVEQDAVDPIPTGTVAIAIPRERIEAVYLPLVAGQEVDIFAGSLYVNATNTPQLTVTPLLTPAVMTPEPQMFMTRIAHRALVVTNATMETASGNFVNVVVLAVRPDESDVVQMALQAQSPMRVIQVE